MATQTRKRKIAEVKNNTRIDSFYKPIPKGSLKKRVVSNDENACTDTKRSSLSPPNSQQSQKDGLNATEGNKKRVFGDSSNKKSFGVVDSNKLEEHKAGLKAKVFGEQKQIVSKSVRQPLQEKSSAKSTMKIEKALMPNSQPKFEVLRDPTVDTSQSDTNGLNTQFIAESDTLCTQYTDVTSSPLDVFGDRVEEQVEDNGLYTYDEASSSHKIDRDSEAQSPLIVYADKQNDSQDSPLTLYQDLDSDHNSPLMIYKDEDNTPDSPLAVYNDDEDPPLEIYNDDESNGNSPFEIYKDNDDSQDSPLVIYRDEDDSHNSPLIVYKDEDESQRDSPLQVYRDDTESHDSPLQVYKDADANIDNFRIPLAIKQVENDTNEDEPPFIVFEEDDAFTTKSKPTKQDEDSLEKMINTETQKGKKSFLDNKPGALKRSSKSFFSDNYDELGSTIDSSKDFFDDDDEEDQHDYADVINTFNIDDFSVTNTFSQESIESTPPVVKSPLPPPVSVLGSKTFFSKYGAKK